jgi:hypothetical protein
METRHCSCYSYARNNPLILTDPTGEFWWGGFYTNWSGYDVTRLGKDNGLILKAGEVLGGRFTAQDAIAANAQNISNSSAQTGVSPSTYQAIMYEENSHQFPPFNGERTLENLSPDSFSGGVGTMQVSSAASGLSNTALLNDSANVSTAGGILQGIKSQYGSDPSIMGAYYNSGKYGPSNGHANLYGQRVSSYANMSFTPTFGDRVVRASYSSISSSLGALSSALSRLSDTLKKRKE